MIKLLILITLFFFIIKTKEAEEEGKIETLKIGNFALPPSQQPSAVFSFGQNIVEKKDLIGYLTTKFLKGHQKNFSDVTPTLLYGISNELSILLQIPIALKFKEDNFCSKGLLDLILQGEYVIYSKNTLTTANTATIVGNITFPSGSNTKKPITGFGSPSFFLGFTANHGTTKHYFFTSIGSLMTTEHQNNKFGNQILYQFGFGKNIMYKKDKWIFNYLLELNGIYRQKDKINGINNNDSGGNQIFLCFSLLFSTERLILQAGIAGIVSQHLFGTQNKDKYIGLINIGWKF